MILKKYVASTIYQCSICCVKNIVDRYKESHPHLSVKKRQILHYTLEHNDQMIACIDPACGEKFIWPNTMKIHYKRIHLQQRIQCSFCSATYLEFYLFDMHMDEKHPEKQEKPFKFKCTTHDCFSTYTSSRSLQLHIYKHAMKNKGPQKCPVCHKLVMNLPAHKQRVHPSKPRNISCWHCEKKFLTTSDCKIHLKRLAGPTFVSCKICGKCLSKNTIRNHMRSVHENVRFTCSQCGKSYSKKADLQEHVKAIHKGLKPSCRYCKRQFTRNSDRNRHERETHGNELT